MATKPSASSADLTDKTEALEVLADGAYALTAEGDPNVGAVKGEGFLVRLEARATPAAARDRLAKLRERTDEPVRYLVLSHYHAVRVLGASAFGAHEMTRALIAERGKEDWESELGRMPRLFAAALGLRPGEAWIVRPDGRPTQPPADTWTWEERPCPTTVASARCRASGTPSTAARTGASTTRS